jgi:hypothetical protein
MEAPDPTLVGNNFIIRYYTVLSRNPDALHHFYSDRSSRTFGNEDEESAPIKGIEVSLLLGNTKACFLYDVGDKEAHRNA